MSENQKAQIKPTDLDSRRWRKLLKDNGFDKRDRDIQQAVGYAIC